MVTRLERLLLVCAIRFVSVLVTINDLAWSYASIIKEFDVSGTIHQFCMYGLLESVLGANWRWNPWVRCWCGHGFLTQPKLASQSVSTSWELQKLLGNRICNHGLKSTETDGKKRMERYGIPNFRRFRKSLATSNVLGRSTQRDTYHNKENHPMSTKGYVTLFKLPLRVMRRGIARVREKSVNGRVHNKWTGADVSHILKGRWRSKPRVMTWCHPGGTNRWATLKVVAGDTLAYKREASKPYLQRANKHSDRGPTGRTTLYVDANTLGQDGGQDGGNQHSLRGSSMYHPRHDGKGRDCWSGERCDVFLYQTIVVCKTSTIDEVAPAEDYGEISDRAGIQRHGATWKTKKGSRSSYKARLRKREWWMTSWVPPTKSVQGRSDTRRTMMIAMQGRIRIWRKPKRYVIVSKEEEDESGKPEDDQDRNPDHNPFWWEDLVLGAPKDPRGSYTRPVNDKRGKHCVQPMEKALEEKGYPFKKINEDVYESDGYVEEDWYEPRGTYSLHYHYSEDDIQYIFWRRAEKRGALAKKEVIDLTGDKV